MEAVRVMDFLDELPVLSNAIYVIVENVEQNGELRFDSRIGATIVGVVKHYLEHVDLNSILVFDCFVEDGKQIKRHNKFDRWYRHYALDMEFVKMDEEILEPHGDVYVPSFVSILYRKSHPRKDHIEIEMVKLRSTMMKGK